MTNPRWFGLFWLLSRQFRRNARFVGGALSHDRANATGGAAWCANRGTQIHDGLRVIPRPLRRGEGGGMGLQLWLCTGQRGFHCEEARHDTLYIAIHDDCAAVKGNRRDRSGGVRANSGKRQKRLFGCREYPRVLISNHARAFEQVARPCIIAKPRPSRHDIRILRCGKILNPRPERDELGKVVTHSCHGCLL